MNLPRNVSPLIPLAALAFVIAHLAYEYFNRGIKTHSFLARADLPGFSNWLALAILPLLGAVLAIRIRLVANADESKLAPRSIAIPLAASFVYGGVLAASF